MLRSVETQPLTGGFVLMVGRSPLWEKRDDERNFLSLFFHYLFYFFFIFFQRKKFQSPFEVFEKLFSLFFFEIFSKSISFISLIFYQNFQSPLIFYFPYFLSKFSKSVEGILKHVHSFISLIFLSNFSKGESHGFNHSSSTSSYADEV